ncbi:hypothetical protein ES708_29032 [subsurface metagenome]
MEKPTKGELIAKLDEVDKLVRERLTANPDPVELDTLLAIRAKQQELMNLVLAM